ncbi:MAG: alpha/beta hydrolase [Candidatus Nitrosocosmicus sp.]|nr:alpha/beta hydrolase [Candidatus Nitrosocosmicus sp.]MDN5868320.1 alpha/beta hydrolase [Candidatus Nitrosocosmicus sp.]
MLIAIILSLLMIAAPLANFAYSQPSQMSSTSSSADNINENSLNIQDIPAKKVRVGDIDVAYKTFGKGDPIILINGYSFTMDSWDSTLLETLASNHTVIVFDNRGIGNTTSGNGQFSVGQFANDTAGLLDALDIKKADVLSWSLGGAIAQELTLNYPDKVGRLILYAIGCGGANSVPPSQEFLSVLTNGTGTAEERIARLVPLFFPEEWRYENPNYLENIPKTTETVLNETLDKQIEAAFSSSSTCDSLKTITQPTLVIVGTDDAATPAPNSLSMAQLIPGAWFVQINGADHGLMYQYPEQFSGIVEAFLENTNTS